ncbi:cell division protein [Brevibacillus fortis]|uniref:Cell division protein n=1 Tax=Brevibacillus fortis TaxID=2126352 RepID=A0A2P7UVT6_9BACL|nr:cell division protein [Brevibacillus fortis]
MKSKLLYFLPIFVLLPATLVGSFTMISNDAPIRLWLLNIVLVILGGFLSSFILFKKKHTSKSGSRNITIMVIFVLLLLTFLDSGVENVHRWISIGPFQLYIASIVLPFLIVQLWSLLVTNNWWITFAITTSISLLVSLQPDASEVTAFTLSMAILLWSKANHSIIRYFVVSLLFIFVIRSWIYLDHLLPVSYVEGILYLVADMGTVWLLIGVISILILILPFLFLHPLHSKILSLTLGIHFTIIYMTTFFGNFPVPIMGYGASPIIGYLLALTSIIRSRKDLPLK